MKLCAILIGEIRTLDSCIHSIKRLFKDILNVDFFVVINKKSNIICDFDYYDKLIKDNLKPKTIDYIELNQKDLSSIQMENKLFENINIKITNMLFDEYSKLDTKETFYTVEEIQNLNVKYEKKVINGNQFCSYPYNLYIEDYMLNVGFQNIKETDNYTHIFRLRTDVAWFEDFQSKNTYIDSINDKSIYQNYNNISPQSFIKPEYNQIVKNLDFNELKNNILNEISKSPELIILSSFFYIKQLNIYFPCSHVQFMSYNNMKKCLDLYKDDNIEQLIKATERYPKLGPNWQGEQLQKMFIEELNLNTNKNLFFHFYSTIIRR